MQRDSAAEYFFSLIDSAASAILRDPLREVVPPVGYRIENEKHVEVDPSISAIFEEKKPAEAQGGQKSAAPSALDFMAPNEMLLDCHDCEAWLGRPDSLKAGVGASKPLFLFVLDRVNADGSFFTVQEDAFFSKWLAALRLDRNRECHFTSVIKCPSESGVIYAGCEEILVKQIEVLRPRVLVMLGSAGAFLATGDGDIFKSRGKVVDWHGCKTIFSFSPAQVLADYQNLRRPIWEDLKLAARVAGTADRLA